MSNEIEQADKYMNNWNNIHRKRIYWWIRFFLLLMGVAFAEFAHGSASQVGSEQQVQSITKQRPSQIRALHFVMRPSGDSYPALEIEMAKRLVILARDNGFNTIIMQLANGIYLQKNFGVVRPGVWNKEQLQEFVAFSRSNKMEVIPEIELLTHQEKYFENQYPKLMFNRSTYNPNDPLVYEKIFAYLDEVIEVMHPKSIHIGHDEVAGYSPYSAKKWMRKGEKMLPADLFLQDVLRLHGYLKPRGIKTWMWGDMLISPDEFPDMNPKPLHGGVASYGKALRDKLPKDIVISDWHYSDDQADFPSLAAFRQEGFRVLGSTWKKPKTIRNFSRYAVMHGADGMIATTWFHVPRKEWNVVDRIIRESGKAFKKDFPDEK